MEKRMIKAPLPKGQLEIVVGERHVVEGDPYTFEAHVYLKRGEEMHGGVGKTAAEALSNAVMHWQRHEDKAGKAAIDAALKD
jgi:hypothetical protein